MEYTVEQLYRVLSKSADMKAAIDDIQYITKNGIYSWAEFGNAMDVLYKARDEYMNVQHEIANEAYNT